MAGFDVVKAYDLDPILTSSFPTNFPDTTLDLRDISSLSGAEVLSGTDGAIDGLIGGPPCQGFSSIGRRHSGDPRRQLLGHFFRLTAEVRPRFFVMENVLGLTHGENRHVLNAALELVPSDYVVMPTVTLDASDFGAATSRRRVFVVGFDPDRCDPPNLTELERAGSVTVRDAIHDLMSATPFSNDSMGFDVWELPEQGVVSKYAKLLRSKDRRFTGHRRTKHTRAVIERFSAVPRGGIDPVGRHPRLEWGGLCPTLRAGTGSDKGSYQSVRPIHPIEPRVITAREAARLQGFPDAHKFHPTIWHSFRMIGNSVSPFVAKALLTEMACRCQRRGSIQDAAEKIRATG